MPLWFWPTALLVVSFALGVVAVLGGVGGGVLYVPIVGCFMPFHLDFVRCAGLLVALAGSVAAGPGLLRRGLADLRLAMPMALVASVSSIAGALIGLRLSTRTVETAMGLTILAIAAVMALAGKSDYPDVARSDRLSRAIGITGAYVEESTGSVIVWRIRRSPLGLVLFAIIGLMAGMFGVGAGWANVPVLNLVLGTPLKLAVATSKFMIAVTDSTAAWVYINSGTSLPLVIIPSIAGIMLGSVLGVRLLAVVRPRRVRLIVLVLLATAGTRALLKGLNIWR